MKRPPDSYSRRFRSRAAAEEYDLAVYGRHSVSDLLWRVEKRVLEDLIRRLGLGGRRVRYLDFACGTGRILELFQPHVTSALGLDISPEMLARARQRLPEARLVCWDITAGQEVLDNGYDLITSFRFITNAEIPLTRKVLQVLRDHLDATGHLLVNIHANPLSYRGLMIPYYWLKEKLTGKKMLQHLSRRQTAREIRGAGLEIVDVIGIGFVSARLLPFIPFRLALAVEKRLAGFPGLQFFGVNQLFVCRRRE